CVLGATDSGHPKVPQVASLSWDRHALARNPERGRRRKGLAMLRVYRHQDNRLVPTELAVSAQSSPADVSGGLWIDLLNPTKKEDQCTETVLGVSIPTRDEAEEIGVSARLYHEDGAEFMTMTGVSQLETDVPATTPITFVLKGDTLVTIRYAEPKPFWTYAT